MTPIISVIIPTYQRPELLRQCLDALAQQTIASSQFEVLVVDDGDQPQTALAVRKAIQETGLTVRYLAQPQRRGPAAARNRGWHVALSPLIAFTNDDCIPDQNWLAAALADFNQDISVLTGQFTNPTTGQSLPKNLADTVEFTTTNLFCRRSVLDVVGGFDEAFDTACREGSELQFKLLRMGISSTPCPKAVITHAVRQAPWYAPLQAERKTRYDALLYRKHPDLFRQRIPTASSLIRRHYLTVSAMLVSLMAVLAGEWTMALTGLYGWFLMTAILLFERLSERPTNDALSVGQVLVLSVATPFWSVYWRIYGAVKYKALYL